MFFKIITTATEPKISDTDFKTFCPAINRNTDWSTVEPFITEAEDFFIIPAIGEDFYLELDGEYQATGEIADATLSKIFRYLKFALANFTSYLALMRLNMRFGDAGAHETNTADIAPVRQWVFNGNRYELSKTAYNYLDKALSVMESEALDGNADLDSFKNSAAWTVSRELLIPNAATFQKYYNINSSRRAFVQLRPYIQKAEELYLKGVLCELFPLLKAAHTGGDFTGGSAPLEALLEPARRLLAEQTLLQAIPDLNFVKAAEGWMITDNSFEAKPQADHRSHSVQQLITRAEQNAAAYEIALKNAIYSDLDEYPAYRDGACNDLTLDSDGDGVADVDESEGLDAGAFIL
jgi:hypothetical protein